MIYYPYYAEDFYRVVEKQEEYEDLLPSGFNLVFCWKYWSSSKF